MCNSSSGIFNRTYPSLLYAFVVDTLLNFPMPFNIILTYPNTFRVNAFRCLLVLFSGEGGDLRQKRNYSLKIASLF